MATHEDLNATVNLGPKAAPMGDRVTLALDTLNAALLAEAKSWEAAEFAEHDLRQAEAHADINARADAIVSGEKVTETTIKTRVITNGNVVGQSIAATRAQYQHRLAKAEVEIARAQVEFLKLAGTTLNGYYLVPITTDADNQVSTYPREETE